MTDATPLSFELPAVARKKLTVGFDGANQSSDAGLLLLRGAEKKSGVVARLAAAFRDRRDPARIQHRLGEIIAARVFGICCGWEDAERPGSTHGDQASHETHCEDMEKVEHRMARRQSLWARRGNGVVR